MAQSKKVKFASIAASGVIAIVSALGVTQLSVMAYLKEELKDHKTNEQILKDAAGFGTNMSVAKNFIKNNNPNFIRLKIEKGEPVVVVYQDDMQEFEVEMIENAINYYGKVFKTIDEAYSFKVVSDKEYKHRSQDTIIKIENTDLSPGVKGLYQRETMFYRGKEYFVNEARISINNKLLKEGRRDELEYCIVHELGHSFGLGDVYNLGDDKIWDCEDRTTLMNLSNCGEVSVLYPNDYSTLQALYSNEYLNHESYEESISVVMEKINDYSEKFYEVYAQNRLENRVIGEKFAEKEEINIEGIMEYGSLGSSYEMKVKDGIGYFSIFDDKGGILEECQSSVHFTSSGIMIMESITLDKIRNYCYSPTSGDVQGNIMLFVYQNENNEVKIMDNLHKYEFSGKIIEQNKVQKR